MVNEFGRNIEDRVAKAFQVADLCNCRGLRLDNHLGDAVGRLGSPESNGVYHGENADIGHNRQKGSDSTQTTTCRDGSTTASHSLVRKCGASKSMLD